MFVLSPAFCLYQPLCPVAVQPSSALHTFTRTVVLFAESHILEDVNKCIIALREQNADDLDRAAGAIRGRASRVAHIVSGEMDNYEPGAYTEGVMKNVQYLTKNGKSDLYAIFSVS